MQLKSLKGFALSLTVLGSGLAQASPLGDRLVLAINSVPYTQRQVETYINVKESLRKTNDGNVRVIDATNWHDALTVYTEDMIILQEAQRLGSFATQDQLIDKYQALVKSKVMQGGELKQALIRLGVDEAGLAKTLDDVLRVAAFRRSKDKQEAQGINGVKKNAGDLGKVQWLDELTNRAIARPYEGARTYLPIEPVR